MILRSGDVPKIAPNRANVDGLVSLHKLDDSLRLFRHFGIIKMTFLNYDEVPVLGGDRRLYPQGLAKASWGVEMMSRCGLDAIFTHISFNPLTDFDKPVTIRTWNKVNFSNYSATLQYLPTEDQDTNEGEVPTVTFTFIDMVLIS